MGLVQKKNTVVVGFFFLNFKAFIYHALKSYFNFYHNMLKIRSLERKTLLTFSYIILRF